MSSIDTALDDLAARFAVARSVDLPSARATLAAIIAKELEAGHRVRLYDGLLWTPEQVLFPIDEGDHVGPPPMSLFAESFTSITEQGRWSMTGTLDIGVHRWVGVKRWRWWVHNVVAHPLLVLWPRVGRWLHDRTVPDG